MSVKNNIAIYGAGGFGKETKYLLDVINKNTPRYFFRGFIDDYPTDTTRIAKADSYDSICIAIALPSVRKVIYDRLNNLYAYPSLIHPGVDVHESVNVQDGCIICGGVQMTVDIAIGKFVIINLNATIGHDVVIKDFASIMPNASISGSVTIGQGAFIGSGAVILQGLKIGEGAVIGAGAVVTKNVPDGLVVKGVPGRF